MKVPYFVPDIGNPEREALLRVLDSGWLTTGALCKQFEEGFAMAVKAQHALAVNSCTAALHLALEAVGVQRNDRILVPSLTFAATAEVVRYFGATPIFVDSDSSDCNMSLESAAAACETLRQAGTPAKAIIPVHYGGKMVDMRRLADLARRYDLKVVEDAAHAFPASIQDPAGTIFPGTLSDAACFSFYANKTITTGEGGMVVTKQPELARRMRIMSLHGIDRDAYNRYSSNGRPEYDIVEAGFKYNMTNLAAALGLEQLAKATRLRDERSRVAASYSARLRDVPGLHLLEQTPAFNNSWHLFAVRIPGGRRDQVLGTLRDHQITLSIHWKALHLMPYYIRLGITGQGLQNASTLSGELLSLPIFPSMTEAQIEYVSNTLRDALKKV